MKKKLYKSTTDKKICGVCGGIAQYFDMDPTLVRVIYVVLALAGVWIFASPIILYIILALIMPNEPEMPEWNGQPPYQQAEYQQANYQQANYQQPPYNGGNGDNNNQNN